MNMSNASYDGVLAATASQTFTISYNDYEDDDGLYYFTPVVAMIYVPKAATLLCFVGSYCSVRETSSDMHQRRATTISASFCR